MSLAASHPALSVIICTHNRPDDLRRCLSALVAQQAPEMEIIVVDSASRPEVRQRLVELIRPHPEIQFEILDVPGVAYARNRGLARARGEWIALLDDDAVPDPDWAAESLALLNRLSPAVGAVGAYTYPLWPGSTRPPLPSLWLRCLSLIEEEREGECTDAPLFVGANMFFRRTPLVEGGGFSPRFGRVGDMLLSGDETFAAETLRQRGWRFWYSNKPRAGHRVPARRLEPAWFRKRMLWEGTTQHRLNVALRGATSLFPFARALIYAPALALLSLGEGRHGTRLARALWHIGVMRASLQK